MIQPVVRRRPLTHRIAIAALCFGAASPVFAQENYLFQAPTGPGGTWNLYQYDPTGRTFKDANNFANAAVNPVTGSGSGRLVSIANALENTIIWNASGRSDSWIGLTDREGAAPGAFESSTTANQSALGWAWTSGEPFNFLNWGGGEPNDFNGREDAAHIRGDGLWNDHVSGYGANDPIAPSIPNTSNEETNGAPAFRSVIEWPTASGTPLPNVRSAAMLGFQNSLPGPSGSPTGFGVREVRGLPGPANIVDAYNKVRSGAGTITDGQLSTLNVTDPDTNGAGGPVLPTAPSPFLSNTAADDNDIYTSVKGKVHVPTTGTYTIQVRSDDGFAFRINGATFSSVSGGGALDPLDASTLYFYAGTGDSNTRGVLTLAAGDYDIEFLHFEGGGGAYYEVSTARGAFTNAQGANWVALGSSAVITNPLRLDAPATLRTAPGSVGNLTDARNLVNAAQAGGTANTSTTEIAVVDGGETGGICCGRAGANISALAVPFPAGTPLTNFATKLDGTFTLNDGDATPGESITLTFGLFSDDGSQLHILGQDFTLATDFSGDGNAILEDIAGDTWLTADYNTGNANAFGLITLVEGQYSFEAFERQGAGDGGLEVFYALGDKTATGLDNTFLPLSTAGTNEGWAAVPEPSSALLGLAGLALLGARRRRK